MLHCKVTCITFSIKVVSNRWVYVSFSLILAVCSASRLRQLWKVNPIYSWISSGCRLGLTLKLNMQISATAKSNHITSTEKHTLQLRDICYLKTTLVSSVSLPPPIALLSIYFFMFFSRIFLRASEENWSFFFNDV